MEYKFIKKALLRISCGENRVSKLMRANHIYSCHTKKYKPIMNSNHDYVIVSNLLKNGAISFDPNQIWVGNIMYIPTNRDGSILHP